MKANITKRGLQARRHAAGMTLIEVLVTLVITSVGLLGVVAMQLATVRNNYDAYVRSQAAVLASDMLDRMRSNRTQALSAADPYEVAYATDAATLSNARARGDVTDWRATIAAQLPNGQGEIATTAIAAPAGPGTPPPRMVVTIRIRWSERAEANPLVFTTSSQI